MNFIKKVVILGLFLGVCVPAHSMWKSSSARSAFNKKSLFVAGAAATAGIAYAKRDELALKLDAARLDIIKQEKFRAFRKSCPKCFQAFVTAPLLRKIRYNSLTEYVQESEEVTKKRQDLARTLCIGGVPLGLSQTEADILAYDNHDKKKEILRGFYSDMRGKYRDYLDKSFFVTELAKLDPLFTTEKELNKDKNIILYHGMATSIYAADYIGTRLQLMDKPNNQDFLSLRQGLEQHVAEQNTQTIENERNIRKNFLEKSGYNQKPDEQTIEALACESDALDPRDNDTPKNNYRVSCSPSLTGSTDYGRSSLESALFAAVCNSGPRVKFDTHNVPQEMMQRYRARLDSATQALSDQCPDSGILLQMALSQKLADKSVYASLPYGFKHNIYTKQTPSQKLEKPSQLFAEVHNNPFNVHVKHTDDNCSGVDPLQLRLIVDKSLLLNPNNPEVREGFKVKAYAMNQEALDTFHREVDGIVSEIGADMQTKNKQ